MDRSALRAAARSPYFWLMTVVTGIYTTAAVVTASPAAAFVPYATFFALYAVTAFVFRYRTFRSDAARGATYAARDARDQALATESAAAMRQYDEDRAARAQAREDQMRDDILSGRRCPAWCEGCDAEQREADRKSQAFLLDRARRHGHPNAGDVEVLEQHERVSAL